MRRPNLESFFAGMSPELRAVYDRMHRRELVYREVLFKEYPAFLVNEIPDAQGNGIRTAIVRGWLRGRQVFAFRHNRRFHLPAFQFERGIPRAVIGKILRLIHPLDGWDAMFWFASANGWLEEGASPILVFKADPDAVLIAASHANDLVSD